MGHAPVPVPLDHVVRVVVVFEAGGLRRRRPRLAQGERTFGRAESDASADLKRLHTMHAIATTR